MADGAAPEKEELEEGVVDLFEKGILNKKEDVAKLDRILRTSDNMNLNGNRICNDMHGRHELIYVTNMKGMGGKATWKTLQSYFARYTENKIQMLSLPYHGNAFWAFQPFFDRLETLKIGFGGRGVVTNAAALVDDSVVELPSLQTLQINGDRGGPPPNFYSSILSATTRLVDLSCRPMEPEDVESFAKIIQTNPLLQKLCFTIKTDIPPSSSNNNNNNNITLAKAIRNHKSIQEISIFLTGRDSPSILLNNEVQRIVEASLLWTPKLQEFELGMNRDVYLGEWMVDCLANTRIATFRHVRPRWLWGPWQLSDGDGVHWIMDGLARNQTIQTLDLTGASGKVADDGRIALLLSEHPTLQTLRFNHYDETNHAKAFWGLSKSQTIKSIECNLLPEGENHQSPRYNDLVADLGQGLEGNKTLERIAFRHPRQDLITNHRPLKSRVPPPDAVAVFCRGLASHPTLRHFSCHNLNFGAKLKQVKEAVQQSTALQEMEIMWKDGWHNEIDAILAKNAVLYNNFLAPTGHETNEVLLPHILAKANLKNVNMTYRCVRDRVSVFVQALRSGHSQDVGRDTPSDDGKPKKRQRRS